MIDKIIDETMFLFLTCIRMPDNETMKFDKINIEKRKYHTVSSYHVTYAFQSESTLYSCLNIKKPLA